MNSKTIIIAVIYTEPEWLQTKRCIEKCGVPVVYVDRGGMGSLAQAFNKGFKEARKKYRFDYAWMVTNITFDNGVLLQLVADLERTGWAAVHPCFESDHIHLRPQTITLQDDAIKPVPFIEFTAPLVRAAVFENDMLDEDMPYWGHDLDWGYRMFQKGLLIGVDYSVSIHHVYIRRNKLKTASTMQRLRNRRNTDESTREALQKKYGEAWRSVVFPRTETEIGAFYEKVKQQFFL